MADTVETAIYRLKYEGLDQAYQAASALGKVEVAEEKLTKATRASGAAFERALGSLDPAIQAYQRYQRAIEQVARWEAAGIGTAQQRTHLIEQATQRYATATAATGRFAVANDNMGKTTGLAAHQMQNLGFQINDVVSGLAMGQSPFTIIAQQGGQVYQILSMAEGGIGGALRGLRDQIMGILTPGRLMVAGFAAASGAAYLLYKAVNDNGPSVEQNLAEHARLVGVIRDAYRDATTASASFYKQSKDQTVLELTANTERLRAQLQESVRRGITSITSPTSAGVPEMGIAPDAAVVQERYRAFATSVAEFQASIARGTPDVARFNQEVSRIGNSDPALRGTAEALLAVAKEATPMAQSIAVGEASLRQMAGIATEADLALLKLSGTMKDIPTLSLGDGTGEGYYNSHKATLERAAAVRKVTEALETEGRRLGATELQRKVDIALTEAGITAKDREAEAIISAVTANHRLAESVEAANRASREQEQLARRNTEFMRRVGEQRSTRLDALGRERESLFLPEDENLYRKFRDEETAKYRERGIKPENIPTSEIEAYARAASAATVENARLQKSMADIRSMGSDFAGGFARDLRNGVTAAEALGNAFGRLSDRLMQMATDRAVNALFDNIFRVGASGGAGAGATARGGLFGGALIPGLLHDGGIAGNAPSSGRYIHPAYFDDAPRFHGGKAPWGPNEIPAILERDEEVLTRSDPRHRWNGGGAGTGSGIVNNITFAPVFNNVTPDMMAQVGAMLRNERPKLVAEVTRATQGQRRNDPRGAS